jgi:predicted secreted protein
MNWITGLAVYLVVWWLVIFMVLPWGNRPVDVDDVAKGHMAGAPKKPRLLVKVAVTTVITTLIWIAIYAIADSGLVTFRT